MKIKSYFMVFLLSAALFAAACATARRPECNIHVVELMDKKKIYLPRTTANDIDVYLKRSPDWYCIPKTKSGKLNHDAAYKAAKSGKIVLATYNAPGGKSGHVVMVTGKKGMVWSSKYNANVPHASGSVNGRKAKIIPMSYQFSADKEPKMNYFIYKK